MTKYFLRYMHMVLSALLLLALSGCREEDVIIIPDEIPTGRPQLTAVAGFYLLNEGNMGMNKATLDFYDCTTATYMRNIYSQANPDVPKELGDVGNDLAIYGSKLYAVVNCSNKVEVMRASDSRRIGIIDIPNCRSIAFHEGYAYVTSYAGPVEIRPDYSQKGFVAKIDTATLQIVDRCIVGYQPDGIAVSGGKAYVCNSGGYMVPNYENTLSVIDLATFREMERVPIAINLNNVVADEHGRLWVSARGDYYDTEAALYCYDTRKGRVTDRLPLSASAIWMHGDDLYVVGISYRDGTIAGSSTYCIIDTDTADVKSHCFITDGTEAQIRIPYGVAVHPVTGDIYVTDARTYINPGYLYCYTGEGILQWSVRTGDIPSSFAFLGR